MREIKGWPAQYYWFYLLFWRKYQEKQAVKFKVSHWCCQCTNFSSVEMLWYHCDGISLRVWVDLFSVLPPDIKFVRPNMLYYLIPSSSTLSNMCFNDCVSHQVWRSSCSTPSIGRSEGWDWMGIMRQQYWDPFRKFPWQQASIFMQVIIFYNYSLPSPPPLVNCLSSTASPSPDVFIFII